MLVQSAKLGVVARLIFGVALCILGCVGIGMLLTKLGESSSQAPVRSLSVKIDPSQREELFDQLRKFANKHAFQYDLTNYGGQGKHFLVYILGDNIKILTVEASSHLDMFSISFYAPSPGDPSPNRQAVDNLVVDLKTFLGKIPNIEISEE